MSEQGLDVGPVTFRVTAQRQAQDIGPDGRVHGVMVVSFVTLPSNTQAEERIPLEQYSVSSVAHVLQERAALIEAVHAL